MLGLVWVCAASAAGDTLMLRDGTRLSWQVTSVQADGAHGAKGQQVPAGNLARVEFAAPVLPAYGAGVVLVDGTVLGGALRKFSAKVVEVRTVSVGLLSVPIASVAAVYYGAVPEARELSGASPGVLLRDGTTVPGNVMWADAKSVGVLGGKGLQKIDAQKVRLVVRSSAPDAARVVLRNGDRLAGEVVPQGEKLSIEVAGESRTLPLEAVKIFRYQAKP